MVASLVQATNRLRVTPPLAAAFGSLAIKARRVSTSNVATNPRYERSSLATAARKLCMIKPPSDDDDASTKLARPLYKRHGSAKVCRTEMMGMGKVGGNERVDGSDENFRFDDDIPCRL